MLDWFCSIVLNLIVVERQVNVRRMMSSGCDQGVIINRSVQIQDKTRETRLIRVQLYCISSAAHGETET
jgi:hypothetical protein